MQLTFTGRNLELTQAIKTFATEKFDRLEQRHKNIKKIHLTLVVEKTDQVAEATVSIDGSEIHASAKAVDIYSAIDLLIDKLLTQITKHKEKADDRR